MGNPRAREPWIASEINGTDKHSDKTYQETELEEAKQQRINKWHKVRIRDYVTEVP